jgi:pimeloyl-ACP methyl ester carboxylesterase
MPYAKLGEVTLFYTDEGAGPPVLLVHGYTCDGSDWSWQIPALMPKHRVVTVDLRGHGHSSAPDEGYTTPDFAGDMAALVAELELEPVIAMGHSMGGGIVASLAAEHPEMVRAVVLVDSALGMDPAGRPAMEQMAASLQTPAAHDIVATFFASSFYPPASPPHLAALHGRRVRALPQHVLAKSLVGMVLGEGQVAMRADSEACLKRLRVPTLTFRAGSQDPWAVATWERAQSSHAYSKAVAWEGTGHFLHQERPAEFNAIVTAWIDGLP